MIIEKANVTFENGDQLKMAISGGFVGRDSSDQPVSTSKIVITYGEKTQSLLDELNVSPGEYHFIATGTQYFEVTELDKAYEVFIKRSLAKKPYKAINAS
jgi:ornithine cyclodeaminase/alanine dehydrogenase-like protein (mu-crystallin family)